MYLFFCYICTPCSSYLCYYFVFPTKVHFFELLVKLVKIILVIKLRNTVLKYNASNVGGLMVEDSIRVFNYLHTKSNNSLDVKELEQILPIKSENSRNRIFQEIRKRFYALDTEIANYFVSATREEQTIILYFAILKTYKLLFDVVFEILIPKYIKGESSVTKMDILSLLDSKAEDQPHIDNWSIRTRNNMATIMLMYLKESGLQKESKISALQASVHFWKLFANRENSWMFEAALLSNETKNQIKTD